MSDQQQTTYSWNEAMVASKTDDTAHTVARDDDQDELTSTLTSKMILMSLRRHMYVIFGLILAIIVGILIVTRGMIWTIALTLIIVLGLYVIMWIWTSHQAIAYQRSHAVMMTHDHSIIVDTDRLRKADDLARLLHRKRTELPSFLSINGGCRIYSDHELTAAESNAIVSDMIVIGLQAMHPSSVSHLHPHRQG